MSISKFKNWEYWPSYMFYVPILPYAFYLAFKARHFIFFSATNPAIVHSGNGSESKYATLQLIPSEFKPTSIYIKANSSTKNAVEQLYKSTIQYPFIIKPDIGFRGLLVNKITNEVELRNYLQKHDDINLIIQELITYNNECGIFYHRLPNEEFGKITSITLKKFLSVTGDGISSLKTLIKNDKRAQFYMPLLTDLHKKNFDLILKKDEEKILSSIGNHAKGTQFINGNYLISKKLEHAIDTIMKQIPNFYYGRLDIRYETTEDLLLLKHVKIIELNGIISEPTHIYDQKNMTYFKALNELRKHWQIMFQIATINHSCFNVKYESFTAFYKSVLQLKKYSTLIKSKN
ncbi:MAG: D-alanine--D-alanine ligase [Lutibacter sp.]|nr:D-alanine--D-alanine ligase [Lutibacter sp.]